MNETFEPERLLMPGEVADLFGVRPPTVARWARAGKLTPIRTLGGHRRFREAEAYELLAARDRWRGRAEAADSAPELPSFRPDLAAWERTVTVEVVDRATACAWTQVVPDWEELVGRRAVVERHAGHLGKAIAIEGVQGTRDAGRAAIGYAHDNGAVFVVETSPSTLPAGER